MKIQPYKIKIDDQILINLRERIKTTRWTDEILDSGLVGKIRDWN